MKTFVINLKVTNDATERAIKLVSDIALSVKNEEELQRKIQLVELHRKMLPKIDKKSLNNFDTLIN